MLGNQTSLLRRKWPTSYTRLKQRKQCNWHWWAKSDVFSSFIDFCSLWFACLVVLILIKQKLSGCAVRSKTCYLQWTSASGWNESSLKSTGHHSSSSKLSCVDVRSLLHMYKNTRRLQNCITGDGNNIAWVDESRLVTTCLCIIDESCTFQLDTWTINLHLFKLMRLLVIYLF